MEGQPAREVEGPQQSCQAVEAQAVMEIAPG
jgi:hypothetical protein